MGLVCSKISRFSHILFEAKKKNLNTFLKSPNDTFEQFLSLQSDLMVMLLDALGS